MGYYWVITFLIAAIVCFYLYYIITKYRALHHIDPNGTLNLQSTDNQLLDSWYEKYAVTNSINFDLQDIACKLLHRLFNITVDKNLLVIGDGITNKLLPNENLGPNDKVFDLRSFIGINLQIVLIHDKFLRKKLILRNHPDIVFLNGLINNNLDTLALGYIQKILKLRWEKILETGNPNILNNGDSFLLLKVNDIPNVTSFKTHHGERINLLCSDIIFGELIKRLKHTNSPMPINL
jgi:hypothetical protein